DASDVARREGTAGLVRVDDNGRRGKLRTGQVMVGDQDVDAARGGSCDPAAACNAVVHRDQQVWLRLGSERDDLGGESVAELEPVRHHEVDLGTECAQTEYADRAGGGAVRVVVGDDDDALLCG